MRRTCYLGFRGFPVELFPVAFSWTGLLALVIFLRYMSCDSTLLHLVVFSLSRMHSRKQ